MAEVTIKAQQTFGGMRAGEVATVERTPYIDRLLARGRVVLARGRVALLPDADADDRPKRNASRDDWAEWLAANTSIVTEGKSRDELLAELDALEASSVAAVNDEAPFDESTAPTEQPTTETDLRTDDEREADEQAAKARAENEAAADDGSD